MNRIIRSALLFLFLFLGIYSFSFAQTPVPAPATSPVTPGDTVRRIDIINADRMSGKKVDSTNELLILAGHVEIRDDKTIFFADSAVHNKQLNQIEAFGNVHINDNDSVHTRSQYLIYYVDKKQAVLKKKVSMTDGKGTLTTEELFYDTQMKIGTYNNGGKVVNGKTVLTSKEATYYGDLKVQIELFCSFIAHVGRIGQRLC